jgi:hypothetical protein
MKAVALTLALSAILTTTAQANQLVCELKENANKTNSSRVIVDLNAPLEDVYSDDNGVSVDYDHYSFTMEVSRKKNLVELNVVFSENNHVQDEVSSAFWTIDLGNSQKQNPVIQEDLNYGPDSSKLLDFSCELRK